MAQDNSDTAANTHEGDEFDAFARARHARYLERHVVYHIISRTRGNLFLYAPDRDGELRKIVAGVLAQARQSAFNDIANFATVLMSNHHHMLLAANGEDPRRIADYMRFFKSETTRRWKEHTQWSGSMWDRYVATAIITTAAQIRALEYTMAQAVKEELVADPRQWPGFHCAESLCSGEAIQGYWFDGTAYGKKRHAEAAKKRPAEVRRADYTEPRSFTFDKLPALAHLSDDDYRATMCNMVGGIIDEGAAIRRGQEPLGCEAICAMDRMTSAPVPVPPWFEERRRMVVWDDTNAQEVRGYLARYWDHQESFRAAAALWKDTQPQTPFPSLSFVPGLRPRPIAHMEQSAA